MPIQVAPGIALDEGEVQLESVRSSGPGGQNVNKVATAVQLRFDVARSPSLPEDVRARLIRLAGNRMTKDGVLVIDARRYRTQERNRDDALAQLKELIRRATVRPKVRQPTKPTAASQAERLARKTRRSRTKQLRRSVRDEE